MSVAAARLYPPVAGHHSSYIWTRVSDADHERGAVMHRHTDLTRSLLAAGVVAVLPTQPALAQGTPARGGQSDGAALLRGAVGAVGGERALRGLRTLQTTSSGRAFVLNEGVDPTGEPSPAGTFRGNTTYVAGGRATRDRWRLDLVRNSFGTDRAVTEVVSGGLGYITGQYQNFGPPTPIAMTSDRWAAIRKDGRLLNPQLLLRSALARPGLTRDRGSLRVGGRRYRVLEVRDTIAPIRLLLTPGGRIDRLRTVEHDYMRRDVNLEVRYENWRRSGRLLVPRAARILLDGDLMHDERRTRVRVNGVVSGARFRIPAGLRPIYDGRLASRGARTGRWMQSFAQFGFPKDGASTTITETPVAPGVVLIGGSGNQTLVVDRASGVVVLEGALHDFRAEAIIAYVQRTFPGKSITHVVSHHHHADHSGGLRPFVALGARVVTHDAALGFWRDVFGDTRSTILPDRLDRTPREAAFDAVAAGGSLTLPDATRPITIYTDPTTHAVDTLMTYIQDSRTLVVNGDSYTPGNPPGAGGRALNDNISARRIAVSQIVAPHGLPITFAAFQAALAQP